MIDSMITHYFDFNATTPLASEVLEAMMPFLKEDFGNPSSLHQGGQKAARAVRLAREQVARLLGVASENEIVFTSGGTESNNWAIRGALASMPEKKEIVTSAIEHSSILKLCGQLEKEGYAVRKIGVGGSGIIDLEQLKEAVNDRTAIVSLMSANNETGVLQPIQRAGQIVKEKNCLFHVDAVQSAGKQPLDLTKEQTIDLLSLAAHKFYGPKGTGVLFIRKGLSIPSMIIGGSQERGRRGGTENVAGIVGMGKACEWNLSQFEVYIREMENLRNYFEETVLKKIAGVEINGEPALRLPNTSNLRFSGVDGEALLISLDQKGVCASSGSACMSGSREPSHVLTAMGLSSEEANGSVRFSFGRYNLKSEIDECAQILSSLVDSLKSMSLDEQHSH